MFPLLAESWHNSPDTILVGHSYGGSVITEAGTDSHVVGWVYIAAHIPDAGESEREDVKRFPSALSKTAVQKTPDGFTYIQPNEFREYFATDLPSEVAAFAAHSQMLIPYSSFGAKITMAAWKTKPSWILVATSDKTINPDLERWYGSRAHSHMVEVEGASHAVFGRVPKRSQPSSRQQRLTPNNAEAGILTSRLCMNFQFTSDPISLPGGTSPKLMSELKKAPLSRSKTVQLP